jgi:FtsP/CotA-like multicopper oxidase with cupredoxin domain
MSPVKISRRRALMLGGLGVASLATGVTGWVLAGRASGSGLPPAETGAPLREPPVLNSDGGRLELDLTANKGVSLAGRDTGALGFNGTSPGPTLRVRPGDEIAVRLTNRLDQPTNLHTHGLRVSSQGNSDNPFLRINPGDSFDYLFRVPSDHPAGTNWYHPHHHGTVADQLFGGLAGGLLVDGGPDLPVAADRLLLITDTTLTSDGDVAPVDVMQRAMGRQGELVLINGQHEPSISATADASQRWRIINGCTSRVLSLRLTEHDLVQIAQDGTFLPAPAVRDRVVLAPGSRAEVVVHPGGPGQYPLIADAVNRGSMRGMGPMGGMSDQAVTSGPVTLATMIATGPSKAAPPLPAVLPAERPATGPVTTRRTIAFQMGMGPGGMAFSIDGRTFDPERDDQIIRFGTTEEWTVTNSSPLDHPFHMHVWPVNVIAVSDNRQPLGIPQDVVLIPAGGWVRLRIAFTAYAGRSVYHCHILDHEDAGMMATVNVQD